MIIPTSIYSEINVLDCIMFQVSTFHCSVKSAKAANDNGCMSVYPFIYALLLQLFYNFIHVFLK